MKKKSILVLLGLALSSTSALAGTFPFGGETVHFKSGVRAYLDGDSCAVYALSAAIGKLQEEAMDHGVDLPDEYYVESMRELEKKSGKGVYLYEAVVNSTAVMVEAGCKARARIIEP